MNNKTKMQERKLRDLRQLSAKYTVGKLFESQFKDSYCTNIEVGEVSRRAGSRNLNTG